MDELEKLLGDLVAKETEVLQKEKDIAGIEINVAELNKNLKAVHKNAKSTAEEKQEAELQYATEQEKLKVELASLATLEVDVVRMRRRKMQLLESIKTEEARNRTGDHVYDVPNRETTGDGKMQGSIISQIPSFDGTFGSDAESFVKYIDRTKDQFSWQSKATAQMVRSKLTGAARLFVDNQEKELIIGIDEWDGAVPGGKNLREMLLGKFALPVSAVAATNAIEDLKQEANEAVDSFYERTRFAVDKLLFNVPKGTQDEKANFRRLFSTQVFIFFKAGLLQTYRSKIFSAAQTQIPTDALSLLEAARNAERETTTNKHRNITPKKLCEMEYGIKQEMEEVQEHVEEKDNKSPSVFGASFQDISQQLDAIQAQLRGRGRGRGGPGRFRGRGYFNRGGRGGQGRGGGRGNPRGGGRGGRGRGNPRGQGRCFICDEADHWADKCPKRGQGQGQNQEQPRNMWTVSREEEDEDQYLNE